MKRSSLGTRIRSLRTQNRMTQRQLAEKLHVTDKAVSKWERDLSYPDIALFPKLADLLGVGVNDLLSECVDEGQPSRLMRIFEMSHDIRTPLHIILGCADLAEAACDDRERLLRYLNSIRVSGEYLLSAVDRVMLAADESRSGGDALSAVSPQALEQELARRAASRQESTASRRLAGHRILVAEDMAINREIAGEFLRQAGAEVEFAEDGQACVDMVSARPAGCFSLILMDIMMPNMDGVEAAARIRALPDPRKASVPIIALSANIREQDRTAALAAGMSGFAAKPIHAARLLDMIADLLDRKA